MPFVSTTRLVKISGIRDSFCQAMTRCTLLRLTCARAAIRVVAQEGDLVADAVGCRMAEMIVYSTAAAITGANPFG